MLETLPKTANKLFGRNFIKRISLYLHDCIREEVQSSTFRNLKGDKENKWVFLEGDEELFTNFDAPLVVSGENPYLTELMIQAEVSRKEKHLLYGCLFLTGKNSRAKKNSEFLTPLLYAPCKIERLGKNLSISILEDSLSLNTGALSLLMKKEDEEEIDAMLQGLIDVIPELPINEEKLEIFLSTLKSLIPDVEIEADEPLNRRLCQSEEDFYSVTIENADELNFDDFDSIDVIRQKAKVCLDKLFLKRLQSVILTKRPAVTAGVLHELTQISEKPPGTIKETALGVILDEYNLQKTREIKIKQDEKREFFPVTPLSLSDSQEEVIKKIENNDLLAVYGPPGTGKSQTIVNLVSHLIANNKTVLVASRMDKAVDVVTKRLNELNAPYLALRAGRTNYQKQLCFQLQDLISGKVELNGDSYMDSVLVDIPDMKELLDEIKRLEGLCEKIIHLEEKYTQTQEEQELLHLAAGALRYVSETLTTKEVESLKNILAKLKTSLKKETFLNKIFTGLYLKKIRKILNLKRIFRADEMVQRLEIELDVEKLNAKAREIEEEIISTGNLHQLLNKIKMLKSKRRKLAVEILKNKRHSAISGLLSEQKKRQRLIIHSKSLISKKAMQQNRLLENQDFTPLLNAFPCWCTTTYAISNSLPLKPALFDVVIIDEAGQCDIASCFPILYRAKKAVIVGDDKQFPHLSFLEKAKEQSFLNQYNIDDKYQLMWRFRTNSMFDLANYYSVSPVLLDEHFRSPRPIIEFSSKEFYGGRIKVMKTMPGNYCPVELIVIPDGKTDADVTRNSAEAEAVIRKVQDIIANDNSKNPISIGILSPFRGQVDMLKKDVMKVFSMEAIQKHQIEVGTAHTFQGDEKDVMLMSWTIADNSRSQSLTFLQKPNLFNVAITRARKKSVNFISKAPNTIPEGLLRDYIEYIQNAKKAFETVGKVQFKNDFEKEVYNELALEIGSIKTENAYLNIQAGLEIGGVNADIVIDKLVIEIDGMEDKTFPRYSNMKKQAILERCGFNVIHLTKREWDLSKKASLERIFGALSK